MTSVYGVTFIGARQ